MTPWLAHGGEVPLDDLAWAWEAPPLVLASALLAAALFAQAFVRLRRRGRRDHAPAGRLLLFSGGLVLAVLALASPLDAAGEEYLLSAHMAQHLLIADVAPLLLVLAVRGPLAFFLLPASLLRALAPVRPLRAALSFLLRPWISFGVWLLVVLGWHVPRAYEYALAHPLAHELEHVLFVTAGLLVWTQLIDPARHHRLSAGGRVAFGLGVLLLGHPVIDALLASDAAYGTYATQDERLFGLSPVRDQRLAGGLMLVEQMLTVGTYVALLLVPLVREWRARRLVPAEERS